MTTGASAITPEFYQWLQSFMQGIGGYPQGGWQSPTGASPSGTMSPWGSWMRGPEVSGLDKLMKNRHWRWPSFSGPPGMGGGMGGGGLGVSGGPGGTPGGLSGGVGSW